MKRGITILGWTITFVELAFSISIPANQSTVFNPSPFVDLKKQVECDFEAASTCHWYISTQPPLLFKLNNLGTPTGGTGPDFDHTKGQGSNGFYLYLESSAPSKLDETAMLVSSDLLPTNNEPVCFSFWYHMFGPDVGTLQVRQVHKTNVTLFSMTGNQGQNWQHGRTTVMPPGPVSIVIEASVGDGYQGDIAVDDFTLTDGVCQWLV